MVVWSIFISILLVTLLQCTVVYSGGGWTACGVGNDYYENDWYVYNSETMSPGTNEALTTNEYCTNETYSHLNCKFQEMYYYSFASYSMDGCVFDCSELSNMVAELNSVEGMPLCMYFLLGEMPEHEFIHIIGGQLINRIANVDCSDVSDFDNQCPVDGKKWYSQFVVAEMGEYQEWGAWSEVCSPCNDEETDGTQTRTRTCSEPSNGGFTCEQRGMTDLSEEQACSCPEDGKYQEWGAWSEACNPCNDGETDGTQTRTRTCSQPSNGGFTCEQRGMTDFSEEQECSCPGDGAAGGSGRVIVQPFWVAVLLVIGAVLNW